MTVADRKDADSCANDESKWQSEMGKTVLLYLWQDCSFYFYPAAISPLGLRYY